MAGWNDSVQRSWVGVRMLSFFVAAALALTGLAVTPTPAFAVTVDTGTWFVLVNQQSGKALDVATRAVDDPDQKVTSTDNGATTTQYTRDGTASQQWKFVDAGNGYYKLSNRYSGKILDVPGFSTVDGTALDQWGDSSGANVQFAVEESAGGSIQLINRNSSKAVSGQTSSTADGDQVVQSTDADAAQQRWMLVPATLVDPGVWYMLVNENSGKALDVVADDATTQGTDESRINGRKLTQSTAESKSTQQWQLADLGNGYYKLRNKNSDKVLDVPGFSTANGTVLDQWSDTNGTNVQFQLVVSGNGVFRLVNRNSAKAVSVSGSSTADGADVVQSTDVDGANQRWRLVPVKAATWYVLVNQNSGKALDVASDATTDGAALKQMTRDDTAAQQWQFLDAGNGYYKLRNRNSNRVLDVPAFSTADGTVLDQWGDTHGTNVQFRLVLALDGLVELVNRNSGKAVSVAGSSTADGADVVQSTDAGGANQKWRLLPVATAAPVTVATSAWYVVVNRNSGKALDVVNDATTDGAKVTQSTRDGLAPQQWKFVDAGNGYYKLRNRNSSKVLDVPAFSTADGTALDQWTESSGTNVQFRIAESADGLVRLVNRNSGKAIKAASTADGADIVQSTDLNSSDQQWMLYPVDTSATTTVNTKLWYVLVNRNSGKALDDYGLRLEDGAKVVQYTRNDGYWQQWQFLPSGDGYYRLRNRHSNNVLNVWGDSTANGAAVKLYKDVDAANEQFRIDDAGSGYVQLVGRHSQKAVEVYQWSTADGADIVQWSVPTGDNQNQEWQLVPVGGTVAFPMPEPVYGGTETHDPTVIKKPDGNYLMSATMLGLATSDDRVTWTPAGEVFPNGSPSWTDAYTDPSSHMLWAPDLSYDSGKYYLYYSASNAGSKTSAIGLATSTSGAAGTWVDQGKVLESNAQSDFNAIDPNLVIGSDGRWWLAYGSYVSGIKMVEINPTTGMKLNSTVYSIASRNDGIEPSNDWYGRVEAPFILKHGSYYYLYVSFDGCCADGPNATYRVMVGRSTNPTGPYVDRNGTDMMDGGGTEILAGHDAAVYGTGHMEVLPDTDADILFYHYYAANKDGASGCHYCKLGINHVGYDSQAWPYVY